MKSLDIYEWSFSNTVNYCTVNVTLLMVFVWDNRKEIGSMICEFALFCILKISFMLYRFVRPTAMSEERVNEYIYNKYGKFGVDRYDALSAFHVTIYD